MALAATRIITAMATGLLATAATSFSGDGPSPEPAPQIRPYIQASSMVNLGAFATPNGLLAVGAVHIFVRNVIHITSGDSRRIASRYTALATKFVIPGLAVCAVAAGPARSAVAIGSRRARACCARAAALAVTCCAPSEVKIRHSSPHARQAVGASRLRDRTAGLSRRVPSLRDADCALAADD